MRARQSAAKGSGFAIKLGVRPKPTSPRPTTPRLNGLQQAIDADRRPRWIFVQRGYWVHGVGDLRSSAGGGRLTLDGRAEWDCPADALGPSTTAR